MAILEVSFLARNEAVVSRKVVKEALIVSILPIFEALDLNMTRLLFFFVVDLFAQVGEATKAQMIEYIELKSPDNVGGILDATRLFETPKGNALYIVCPIEAADDDKGSIGFALKFLELAH